MSDDKLPVNQEGGAPGEITGSTPAEPQETPPVGTGEAPPEGPGKKKRPRIVYIVAAVLVLAGAGVLAFFTIPSFQHPAGCNAGS